MPKFEVYSLDGSLQINLASRLTKFLGSVRVNLSSSGSLSNASLNQGTPWYCCLSESDNFSSGSLLPSISVSGTTLSWTSNSVGNPSFGSIVYGVYSNGQN